MGEKNWDKRTQAFCLQWLTTSHRWFDEGLAQGFSIGIQLANLTYLHNNVFRSRATVDQ